MDILKSLLGRQAHHKYSKTSGYDHDDGDDEATQERKYNNNSESGSIHMTSSLKPIFLGLSLVIGTLILTGTAWTILQHQLVHIEASCSTPSQQQQKPPPFSKNCGNTPSTARSQNCRFEIHNFAWVPPECYDDALGNEWDSNPNLAFSRSANDSSDTDAQFTAECRAGNVSEAWVPWRQHMSHCALILKKYLRSVEGGRPMDNWTSSWSHAEHCTDMMLKRDVDMDLFNSLLHVKYPQCDYAWRGE